MRARMLAVLAGLAGALMGCSGEGDADPKVRVVATVFPLADLARQVGGTHVEIVTLVPPGASPHSFEPSPRTRQALQDAQLVLSAGPTDAFLADSMVPRAARHLRLADLVEGAAPAEQDHADHDHDAGHDHAAEPEHEHEHGHDHDDPHYWLNPFHMAELARQTGEALAEIDPANAEDYRARARNYADALARLGEEMRAAGQAMPRKAFIAEHPAFSVMAEVMGLEQIGSIQPVTGVARSPQQLQALVQQILERDVPAIYTEPQLPGRDAETLQREAAQRGRTVKVLVLDPLGNPDVEGRRTYLDNMRTNLQTLREGQQ